jgi:hypothetical protein
MALMGVLIALPIPFGNTIPAYSVILLSLGLPIGDGLPDISTTLAGLRNRLRVQGFSG